MHIEKFWELDFPRNDVYQAWVSSDTVIPPATRMDVNPVVGGHYRLYMDTPEFSGRNEGVFSHVDPRQHVTYTWEWNGDGEITTIDVRFLETTTGTQIKLKHTGFLSEESRSNHDQGWDAYIEGLKIFLYKS